MPVTFVGSFPDPAVRLDPPLPEIAFLGRSNVGKSSLINVLLGRRKLARISATPGKTTMLNVYLLPRFYVVDLPGYGYARASHSARQGYRKLIEGYLGGRRAIAGVVWLLDIRHQPTADDQRFLDLMSARGLPVLAVLTKADKLGRVAQEQRQTAIARELGLEPDQVQRVSSTKGTGIAEVGESVLRVLKD